MGWGGGDARRWGGVVVPGEYLSVPGEYLVVPEVEGGETMSSSSSSAMTIMMMESRVEVMMMSRMVVVWRFQEGI